ncbi:mechanosensitive ion channel family protein [Gloeocapsa sp. PCC 73106]|uniref:mechanosensitive ion channel family protein n=1 Tax=Gloeocapsa sp. PCC 73106 TaxID=102232 RepID=UPI0002AC668B|nr:mechanosensitive ion channel family protein [Gloeocapsa sp. PCC 73106]ELR96589.1 small-conductance mechanosensitive channel [Gloeocapsa sp. PCC 73106]
MNNTAAFAYWRLIIPVAIMLTSLIVGLILERIGIRLLADLVQKTQWQGEQIILRVFRHIIVVWCLIAGLYICLHPPLINFYLGGLGVNYYQYIAVIQKVLTSIVIASFTLVIARLAGELIEFYRSRGNFPVNRAFDKITRLVIYSLGTISIVSIAGFSIDEVYRYILPFAIVIASIVLGFIVDKKGLDTLYDLASRTPWEGDELILRSFKNVIIFWFILGGLTISTNIFPLPGTLRQLIIKSIIICFLASATLVIYRLAISFIRLYSRQEDGSATITSLFENITKLVVFTLGFLIILQSIGIGITPLITALGVGGISVGLALKGPLENLASGITIITSKKVRPGDYIKLSSGEEGYVTDVELKYTVIQKITGNLQIIPNAQLISSSFTNYGLPEKKMLLPIEVGVSYDSDLEKVEAVTLAVAREVIEDSDYQPFLCYNRFGYFSINFTVFLQVSDYFEQLTIRHKFIKTLHKRYQEEGIVIPFPIQTPYFEEKENSWDQVKFKDPPF